MRAKDVVAKIWPRNNVQVYNKGNLTLSLSSLLVKIHATVKLTGHEKLISVPCTHLIVLFAVGSPEGIFTSYSFTVISH